MVSDRIVVSSFIQEGLELYSVPGQVPGIKLFFVLPLIPQGLIVSSIQRLVVVHRSVIKASRHTSLVGLDELHLLSSSGRFPLGENFTRLSLSDDCSVLAAMGDQVGVGVHHAVVGRPVEG